jgi:tetratricopeptide (TPR) repeat protein
VYSLGIILYELLAGAPPLDFRGVAFDEFVRELCEEEPPKPSTRIRTQDPATSTDVARKRQADPRTLSRQVRGDLDSIALKALEKDRARRYGLPADLAADIGRYLNHEPVLAALPSVGYRARKCARRYRGALATACVFALVLVVAAAVSIRQSVRANREAAEAQAVNNLLTNDVLAQASPSVQAGPHAKPDPDMKVRTALDRAAARIAGEFDRQPDVEAAIRDTIGRAYMDLGLFAEARTQLARALTLHRNVEGPDDPKTLETLSQLGHNAYDQGEHAAAERLLTQALTIGQRVLGASNPDVLKRVNNLAITEVAEGNDARAEAHDSQGAEISRRVLGPKHPLTLAFMNDMPDAYYLDGKNSQAEALFDQALAADRAQLGPGDPNTLDALADMGFMYQREGKYAEAEKCAAQVLAGRRGVLGAEERATMDAQADLALAYLSQGKFGEGEPLARGAESVDTKNIPDEWQRFRAESLLGASVAGEKRYAEDL